MTIPFPGFMLILFFEGPRLMLYFVVGKSNLIFHIPESKVDLSFFFEVNTQSDELEGLSDYFLDFEVLALILDLDL